MIAVGERVQGSDSREFDLSCRGAVGILLAVVVKKKTGHWYRIGPDEDKTHGLYRYIRRITKEEDRQIRRAYWEKREEWYRSDRRPIGDQIREFLRQEARDRKVSANLVLPTEG